jgi:cell division protein ZapB
VDPELKSLEQKIAQLVELSQRLRQEKHKLRQQLATALNENRLLEEKIASATSRLENLLNQIPEDEA